MKKVIIGSLVGGLIIFFWQTLSHVAFNLHEPVQQYTAKQDTILHFLNKQELAPGGYIMPRLSHNQSMDELEGFTKSIAGKPWARVIYYPSYKTDMTMNMIRGFVLDVFMVFLLVWIISKLKIPRRSTIVGVSVVIVPPQVLLPLILRSTPSELTPIPLIVSGNAPTVIPFCSCSVAPLATVVMELLPNAFAFCILIIPALILVAPV